MPNLITAIPAIHPVRNLLRIVFEDAALPEEPSEIEVQLETESVYGSDEWEVSAEFLNPFDAFTKRAAVVINRALLGILSQIPPDPNVSGVQLDNSSIKRYRLKYRLVIDGEPNPTFTTSAAGHAWLAGSEYTKPSINLDGKAYLFQTTKPIHRTFHLQESIMLSILPITSGTASLAIKINFTDDTDQTESLALESLTSYRPISVFYNLPEVEKTIRNVEFTVSGLSGTAEKLTYKLIPGQFRGQLIYANSLGGFDHIHLRGKREIGHTDEGEFFEGQLLDTTDFQEGNMQTINQEGYDTYILRTGFISLPERKSLNDLTLRNQLYLNESGDLIKLVLQNEARQVQKDGEFLYSLILQARTSFSNKAYSRTI